jgi:hypothetical protein
LIRNFSRKARSLKEISRVLNILEMKKLRLCQKFSESLRFRNFRGKLVEKTKIVSKISESISGILQNILKTTMHNVSSHRGRGG